MNGVLNLSMGCEHSGARAGAKRFCLLQRSERVPALAQRTPETTTTVDNGTRRFLVFPGFLGKPGFKTRFYSRFFLEPRISRCQNQVSFLGFKTRFYNQDSKPGFSRFLVNPSLKLGFKTWFF